MAVIPFVGSKGLFIPQKGSPPPENRPYSPVGDPVCGIKIAFYPFCCVLHFASK
jgi:hypothetical protein